MKPRGCGRTCNPDTWTLVALSRGSLARNLEALVTRAIVFIGAVVLTGAHANADVVYGFPGPPTTDAAVISHDFGESSSTSETAHGPGAELESQTGQRVTLAGTDRFVTQIDMALGAIFIGGSSGTATLNSHLRLYTFSAALPDQLLWEGDSGIRTLNLSLPFSPVPISFTPNILVPDTFVIAVSHTDIAGEPTGWRIGNAANFSATIGSSGSVFSQSSVTGAWVFSPSPFYGIHARITAVPGPAGLGVGIIAVAGRARRRR